jgi:hypothetical protein
MSGKSEFAEGLAKAAREAFEEVTGGADDVAKAKRQRAIDAAKRKDSPQAYEDRRKRRQQKAVKVKAQKSKEKLTRSKQEFSETLTPVIAVLKRRGTNWSSFVDTRMNKDPNLAKLAGRKARRARVRELFDELGEEGFIKRFNL